MEAPDSGLLITPQRDALASGLEPLLLQLQVASVLIVNGFSPGQFIHLGVGLLHRQMQGLRGVGVRDALG